MALAGLILGLAQCAASTQPVAPPTAAPAAPNRSAVTAQVLDAIIVDSPSLNISPPQPLCVLTLKLVTVRPVAGVANALEGRAGETIRALSKDVSLAGLKGKTVSASVSLRGDERGGSFWIVGTPTVANQ